MKRAWRIAGGIGAALLIVLAFVAYRTVWGKPFSINMLANRQALEFVLGNPELFTTIGLTDGTVLDFHSGKLTPYTLEYRDHAYAQTARFLKEVRWFDRAKLARQDQMTYDILVDQYETALGLQRFDWLPPDPENGPYPIWPSFGIEAVLPLFMESTHVVRNDKTARNYVRRLEAMGSKLDAATAELQRQSKVGVVLPPSLLERSLTVIADTVAARPEENALVTSFVERMNKVKSLDETRKRELEHKAVEALRTGVYPAYARMSAALIALRPLSAGQGAGVGRLPEGPAYYAVMLKAMTTTDYAPEKVHALGLAEVARISAEMDTLLNAQGLASGSVGARMAALGKDPRFLFPNTDEGRKQALDRYQQLLDEMSARLAEYFPTLPTTRLKVVRVPESQEKGAAGAFYEQAAMDGSRPGTFFANLRDMNEVPIWGMKTVAYHEGVPGHHLQISIALGLKDLPLIRQQTLYTAYAEGWALYAEQLAAEMGMYKDDPWGNLGRLQLELLRAARLVVDTGLHAGGWSHEQAIDYMVSTTGMAVGDVTSEVERYMSLPGQACAYKVGELKILELREKAKTALGDKFSLKGFHGVILENGGVPLTLLEQLMDEWIARVGAKS
ncbi:MAG TPA: DUF885 domain-containing protein [Steroidobacteraceae bacterium]|nr:DUF885 domain-containing protein [Steroidobacteraceae bacterium]